jgi:hypothetical protein
VRLITPYTPPQLFSPPPSARFVMACAHS